MIDESLAYVSIVPAGKDEYLHVFLKEPGGEAKDLSNGRVLEYDPVWSAASNQVAFCKAEKGKGGYPQSVLYVMKPDGSTLRALIHLSPTEHAFAPRWSADGKHLAYSVMKLLPGGTEEFQVRIVNAAGSGERTVAVGVNPSWSPDSKTILFEKPEPEEGLYLVPVNGSKKPMLLKRHAVDGEISPDGRWVAYVDNSNPNRIEIWAMNVDGSDPKQITTLPRQDGTLADRTPSWVNEGKQLAFCRCGTDEEAMLPTECSLYVVEASGGQPRQLSRDGQHEQLPLPAGSMFWLAAAAEQM